MHKGRSTVGLSFLAALVLATVTNLGPAQAVPVAAPAALKSASENLSVTEAVHCWDCGYYRPYYRPAYSYYRPYHRPYYRPYRPYWGGGYGYDRPRPYYSGYYGGYDGGYYRGYRGYYDGYAPPRHYYHVGPRVYWY